MVVSRQRRETGRLCQTCQTCQTGRTCQTKTTGHRLMEARIMS